MSQEYAEVQALHEKMDRFFEEKCVVQEWFDADFVRNLAKEENLPQKFKRQEHNITSDEDFKEFVEEILGLHNTFKEAFLFV